MGPFTVSRGSDRRLEGERNGSRSRRPDCDRCRRSPSNGVECGDRPPGAHGRQGARSANQPAADSQRDANRRTRAPQGGPGDPQGSQGLRKEPRGRSGRVCRGRRKPAPGLPRGTRVPVAPRATPPGAARDGRRVRRFTQVSAYQHVSMREPTRQLTVDDAGGSIAGGRRPPARDLCRPEHVRCALSRQTRA